MTRSWPPPEAGVKLYVNFHLRLITYLNGVLIIKYREAVCFKQFPAEILGEFALLFQ